ncbi:Uma2 family endonuclease [Nannocystis radixulma]|uniref:Uma2 family endonuclease n=1 Tax=Nannocystis radixulma TaxID=2995305 RepID=A0ABT5B6D6_9BACT|nr:Uma2 family endonuclease [Nannocystis radixulma]MDC0669676.1 Uma2 family endonuclease [Nannocystis radixulma]
MSLSRDPPGVFYPVSDDLGESGLQLFVRHLLLDLLNDYFATHEREVFVGSSQFFYDKQGDPRSVVAPEVYVIDGVSLHPTEVTNWKTWEHGVKAPTLALEIESDEYRKDYADRIVERYQDLGIRELVRYDPLHVGRKHELFAHFVRDEQGRLIRRPTFGDRVQLVSYDLWLVRSAHDVLRLGVGPKGASLWPTAQEKLAEARERAVAEARKRAAANAARAAAEAARAAEAERDNTAQAELDRMRAELAALRMK